MPLLLVLVYQTLLANLTHGHIVLMQAELFTMQEEHFKIMMLVAEWLVNQ